MGEGELKRILGVEEIEDCVRVFDGGGGQESGYREVKVSEFEFYRRM